MRVTDRQVQAIVQPPRPMNGWPCASSETRRHDFVSPRLVATKKTRGWRANSAMWRGRKMAAGFSWIGRLCVRPLVSGIRLHH